MWWQYIDWLLYVIACAISFALFWSAWKFWREERYKSTKKLIPWVFLEIKVPREVLKGPKAMEQFFQALSKLANRPATFLKHYWDGEVTRWTVIDVIGRNNEVRFFMRTSYRYAAAVEGLLYSNYPEIEINTTTDPLLDFPDSYQELKDNGYEIFGNELYQTASKIISIRTYNEFEQEHGDEKGRIIDPFAVLLELIGGLQPSEMLLMQYVLVPDTHEEHWAHMYEEQLESLRNTTQQLGTDKEGNPQYRFRFRTPGEEGVIKRLEEKREKGSFEAYIRYLYVSPKEIYNYNVGYRGIQTFFNQFQHDYQSLERNLGVQTKGEWYYFPWVFPNKRLHWKRVAFYDEIIHRFLPEETFAGKLYNSYFWQWCFWHKFVLLSAEEMATLFHIPTNVVLTQSTMERIESKRLPSPTNLPGTEVPPHQ